MLIPGGDDDEERRALPTADAPDDIEAADFGHLQIEQHQIRVEFVDHRDGAGAAVGLANQIDTRDLRQFFAQHLAGDRFVINDERAKIHSATASRRAGRTNPTVVTPSVDGSFKERFRPIAELETAADIR